MFYLPKLLGSLSCSVLGNARQVFVILISVVWIDHITRLNTLLGVLFFSLSCGWYTYLVVQDKRKAAAERAAQPAPERGTERSPLVGQAVRGDNKA